MISVIIPSLTLGASLDAAVARLRPAVEASLVSAIIVAVDPKVVADAKLRAHVLVVSSLTGRGAALAEGAAQATTPWLLFLHADTALQPGWIGEARAFIDAQARSPDQHSAAAFRFKLDDTGFSPRLLEALVRVRCQVFKLPYGDQGLLISRRLYDEVGGYQRLPLMEDVAIVRQLGRRRVQILNTAAITSAVRYQHDGYIRRSLRNVTCLLLYSLGVPVRIIQRIYG